ncbi:MAG TPA: hypothetical protein VGB85_00825 [Nannocystis sp.]
MRVSLGVCVFVPVLLVGCPPEGEFADESGGTSTSTGTGAVTGSGVTEVMATQGDTGSTTGTGGDTTGTSQPGGTETTSTGSTSDASDTGDTSSGTSGSTGVSSTGSTSVDTTSGGVSASTGESSTTGTSVGTGDTSGESSTSTGDTDTGGDELCCEAGCSTFLLKSHVKAVAVQRSATRIASRDADGNLLLWDATSLEQLLVIEDVDAMQMVGDTLVYASAGQLRILDADDGAQVGEAPAATTFGVAQDESYLWVAGPQGLEVLEPDGAPRWKIAGPLGDAKVLATADAVHVFDADLGPQAVTHYAANDGSPDKVAFLGSFGGWFADTPRYWTTQGNSYRVYDIDDSLIGFKEGAPKYGWGSRMVGFQGVWDIFDPAVMVPISGQAMMSGPAVMTVLWDGQVQNVKLIRLDADPVTATSVTPACCVQEGKAWSFAFADGAWAVGGSDKGLAADDLGRLVTVGEVVGLAGSTAGRVAVGTTDDVVRIYDIADDCEITEHPKFARKGEGLWLSNDGSLLLSSERWKEGMQQNGYVGTRFYSLPDAALLAGAQLQCMACLVLDHEVADDASAWTRLHTQVPIFYFSGGPFPLGPAYATGPGNVLPKISPDGKHLLTSDGNANQSPEWTGEFSYVRDPVSLVGVFEGIPHGFIDDENFLVGRYTGQASTFVKMDIVGLDGEVVQDTTLPELRKIYRISTGEIVGVAHPSGQAAIYDPWTSAVLWTAPPGTKVVVAGTNHVVVSDLASVELVRWR